MAAEMATDEKKDVVPTSGIFFHEEITPHFSTRASLKSILFTGKSKFQDVQVIETESFGKTLVLDHKTQSALADEYIYHECLVHPAMIAHGNPKTVFIGGGGELATAREVLRYPSVEKVVMVDLDKLVVDISRKELPEWGAGAFEDERLEVFYEDAKAFLENYDGKFDVIIMDIADPIEAGPGIALYTQDFYKSTSENKLNAGGVLVTQSGPGGFLCYTECFPVIRNTLAKSFDCVYSAVVEIASFGTPWSFTLAWNRTEKSSTSEEKTDSLAGTPENLDALSAQEIDDRIARLLTPTTLRFYDGISHRGMFSLPRYLRDLFAKETRIMTLENPVFMY